MQHCFLCSDWCISRQLWWGHQIPAYRVELPNSTDNPEVRPELISMFIMQTSIQTMVIEEDDLSGAHPTLSFVSVCPTLLCRFLTLCVVYVGAVGLGTE